MGFYLNGDEKGPSNPFNAFSEGENPFALPTPKKPNDEKDRLENMSMLACNIAGGVGSEYVMDAGVFYDKVDRVMTHLYTKTSLPDPAIALCLAAWMEIHLGAEVEHDAP